MPWGTPLPGRTKPTARQVQRADVGRSQDWFLPDKKYEKGLDRPGKLLCPRCHALSDQKRWFVDERLYRQWRTDPGVQVVVCPGCQRIDRQLYGGDVILRSSLLLTNRQQVAGLLANTEAEARQSNPLARLAAVEERGDEIAILTTTPWLAERIGKEFRKAFKGGTLDIQRLPAEKFVRVRWTR